MSTLGDPLPPPLSTFVNFCHPPPFPSWIQLNTVEQMWIYFVSIILVRMRWSRGRNCSVWSSTEQWSRGIMTSPRLLQDIIIIIIIIITSCQNQEKMRDLAEKLFNTRCGVMVEKVNNRYYHCYYYWWLRRWEIIANIMSWREHKNIWITTIYTVNPK